MTFGGVGLSFIYTCITGGQVDKEKKQQQERDWKRRRYQEDPEYRARIKAYNRLLYQKHRAKRLQHAKERRNTPEFAEWWERSRERRNGYSRKWDREHRERKAASFRKWKGERLARISAIKAERGCACCPERDPVCLDFHHHDPSKKNGGIGSPEILHQRWEIIEAEIAKCAVICANCHRRLETRRRKARKKAR